MLDIHVGIRRDEVKAFKRIMQKQFNQHQSIVVGQDRWEDWTAHWSEELWDDDDILHVVISTDLPMVTLQFLVQVMMVFLNEMTREDTGFEGRYIIVTDHEKWNQYYVELSYPE
jgi:hypothetical protein